MYEQANDDLHTSSKQSGRRDFLKVAGAAAFGSIFARSGEATGWKASAGTSLPDRQLGKLKVSAIGLGCDGIMRRRDSLSTVTAALAA
jgi:hypothetical protein